MATVRLQKYWLVIITFSVMIIGIALVIYYFAGYNPGFNCPFNGEEYLNGSEVDGYEDGFDCVCDEGEIVCDEAEEELKVLDIEKFGIEKLGYSTKFHSEVISDEVAGAQLRTLPAGLKKKGNGLEIKFLQEQTCTNSNKPPVQVGMYNYENGVLTLTATINDVASVYVKSCTVEVSYDLSTVKIAANDDLKILYQTDSDIFEVENCVYGDEVYRDGAVYEADDGCNLCECVNGVTRCSNENDCDDDQASSSVYWNFPNYSRYEGEDEKIGECKKDGDCYVRGCSNEVCSAQQEVNTECSIISKVDDASCGCVDKVCIWH